jgi:hypothetical protein
LRFTVAVNLDLNSAADLLFVQIAIQIVNIVDRFAVNRGDDVAKNNVTGAIA